MLTPPAVATASRSSRRCSPSHETNSSAIRPCVKRLHGERKVEQYSSLCQLTNSFFSCACRFPFFLALVFPLRFASQDQVEASCVGTLPCETEASCVVPWASPTCVCVYYFFGR
ncbi:unnamed protein product [Ectocarpus sp. 4 AP-2014]